jgi:aryl-alcohol dehydrogenase-like predicted oxidoreductase
VGLWVRGDLVDQERTIARAIADGVNYFDIAVQHAGIRVLAGGALSGSAERHPIAGPAPEPIGSAMSYDADIDRARRLIAASLTEAATRFAISHPAMGTILVGMATPQQFEAALAAVEKGPLPQAALDRLTALRQAFSGEPR